jgi:hypothetical protein
VGIDLRPKPGRPLCRAVIQLGMYRADRRQVRFVFFEFVFQPLNGMAEVRSFHRWFDPIGYDPSPPKKEERRTGHRSRNPRYGARQNSTWPTPLAGRGPSAAFVKYKG